MSNQDLQPLATTAQPEADAVKPVAPANIPARSAEEEYRFAASLAHRQSA